MKLRDWRVKHNRTQAWLARRTGISVVLISRYEHGGMPRLPNAIKIARATLEEVSVESWCSPEEIALPAGAMDEPVDGNIKLSSQDLAEYLKGRE